MLRSVRFFIREFIWRSVSPKFLELSIISLSTRAVIGQYLAGRILLYGPLKFEAVFFCQNVS